MFDSYSDTVNREFEGACEAHNTTERNMGGMCVCVSSRAVLCVESKGGSSMRLVDREALKR